MAKIIYILDGEDAMKVADSITIVIKGHESYGHKFEYDYVEDRNNV